jgi:RNA polymerase sigma factor (sigma-70 family)
MASVNILDENLQLWSRFRNGKVDAFGELMRTHYADLYTYGTRFTRDGQLVKDCIQDLFLALWINRLTISETSFVKYYLLKSLRHHLTRALNRSRRRIEPAFDYLAGSAPLTENPLIRDEQHADLARKLRKVLAAFPRRQQEIVYLRYYMEADIEEIAEIMSLSRQSVSHHLNDALHRLSKVSPGKTSWFPHLLPLLF